MSDIRTKPRNCCFCIDDKQTQCPNRATYEIWYGENPTLDDSSDACDEHLEKLLDINNRFEIFRIPVCDECKENDGYHVATCSKVQWADKGSE